MSAGLRVSLHFVEPKPDQFGNPEARGKTDVEHGAIVNPRTDRWIRSVEQGLKLSAVEIVDEGFVSLFRGDRQDAADLLDGRRDSILNEVREGLEGSESSVSRPRGVAANCFDVSQERKDQGRIQLLKDEV